MFILATLSAKESGNFYMPKKKKKKKHKKTKQKQ